MICRKETTSQSGNGATSGSSATEANGTATLRADTANLIYSHICPSIGSIELIDLTEQMISVWCVHLLLRRCLDESAREQLILFNPVRLYPDPQTEEYKSVPLRLGQIQRYLNTAEQLGVLSTHLYRTIKRPAAM